MVINGNGGNVFWMSVLTNIFTPKKKKQNKTKQNKHIKPKTLFSVKEERYTLVVDFYAYWRSLCKAIFLPGDLIIMDCSRN